MFTIEERPFYVDARSDIAEYDYCGEDGLFEPASPQQVYISEVERKGLRYHAQTYSQLFLLLGVGTEWGVRRILETYVLQESLEAERRRAQSPPV
jgi:hypothetical protein